MNKIDEKFEIKNNDVGPPTRYLGVDIKKIQLPDGRTAWSMSSHSYVKASIDTVKRLLAEDGRELKSGKRSHKGPLPHGYKPELDVTDECHAEHVSRYQQLIGMMNSGQMR